MVLTASTMMPIGTTAPEFELADVVSDQLLSLQDLKSTKATVVMFICNHCPFVKHIMPQLAAMANEYQERGVHFIAINSNDVEHHPDDSPENMKKLAQEFNFQFPYLYDESQEVAQTYNAACTPDFFVFDGQMLCFYRGQFDGSRPGNDVPVNGEDLQKALEAVLESRPWHGVQHPSMGCNIKWKAD